MADRGRTRAGSKSKVAGRTDKALCILCSITQIDEDSPGLRCDVCKHCVCLDCAKLPLSFYQELVKLGDHRNEIDWICRVCKYFKSDLKSIGTTLNDLKQYSDARLTNFEDRLLKLESSVKVTVREEVEHVKSSISETLKKDLVESLKRDLTESIESVVETRIREVDDRRNRSNNLLIFKLKASDSLDLEVRITHDMDLVQKLYTSLCPGKGNLNVKSLF
ncbi:hypothetical protein DPMN_185783 [Dreissena polymorpha]|uniref:PHD-type domain-containing protein n=1 Tax=Dreissena polymorpha TaxID=45954 RepID=A0A9D4DM30_DREPO|nr:hypothetical protein DPMN_185783 [Dreissena polymorpha]